MPIGTVRRFCAEPRLLGSGILNFLTLNLFVRNLNGDRLGFKLTACLGRIALFIFERAVTKTVMLQSAPPVVAYG